MEALHEVHKMRVKSGGHVDTCPLSRPR